MSFSKFFFISSFVLLGTIGIVAWFKGPKKEVCLEVSSHLVQELPSSLSSQNSLSRKNISSKSSSEQAEKSLKEEVKASSEKKEDLVRQNLPEADRIQRLFATDNTKFPFVETITYSSRVPWLKGRPAWLVDYAAHFGTTKHFIARSLNRKPDYYTQKMSPGDRFNVWAQDKELQFYLVIDLSVAKAWLYCVDMGAKERVLLKSYPVGLGRKDSTMPSGFLTPLGTFKLGSRVAVYRPGVMGYFQNHKIEMIRVFGTRWLPFGESIDGGIHDAKGYGLHGAPWIEDPKTGELCEDNGKIGKYESDGCIRFLSKDIEEIYSIVLSKPTLVEIVSHFHEAHLPFEEKSY